MPPSKKLADFSRAENRARGSRLVRKLPIQFNLLRLLNIRSLGFGLHGLGLAGLEIEDVFARIVSTIEQVFAVWNLKWIDHGRLFIGTSTGVSGLRTLVCRL